MSRWMAVAAIVATAAVSNIANAADKLVLQLHGPAQFEFAGYYAALWQGYYRAAGLEVEIRPGAATAAAPLDPAREVAEGRAQFGTGTADLVIRAAQGQPLLLLAPIFQRSGAGIYYRAEEDFASPGALADAKLGRLPASHILDIELATALRAEGVDPDKPRAVPLQPQGTVAALAEERVDAVPGSAWDLPWLAHEKGLALKSINPANYRVEFYGDTLFTLRRFEEQEPAAVRSFRTASLKGWDYALQHPDEVADRLLAELPKPAGVDDARGFLRYQAELARALARYPAVALGHSNPDRWNRIEDSMRQAGALLRTADAREFLYDPDARARGRTDMYGLAILGAALLVGLAVALWLWRRGPRPVSGHAAEQAVAGPAAAEAPAVLAPPAPAAPSPPEPASGDLNAVLSGLESTIRQRLPRRVGFRLSLLPELWLSRSDPAAVRALVLDLIDAAAADLKGAGELVVGTRNYAFDEAALAETPGAQLGEFARLTVRDNGPGLSDEALDRVFDPAATARPSAALAAETMRRLGGFARVESAEGVGTAVHLYFPRVAAPEEKPAAAAE